MGQFAVMITGLAGIFISGTLGYSNIANKLDKNNYDINATINQILADRVKQDQINKTIELNIRALETRMTIIGTHIKK